MTREEIMKIDRPIDTEKLINSDGNISIPMKFKLHQKVYHPRITAQGKLLDIREYYIVRIAIVINGYLHLLITMLRLIRNMSEGSYFIMGTNYLIHMRKQ